MSRKDESPVDESAATDVDATTEERAAPSDEREELEILCALARLDVEAALAHEAAAQLDEPALQKELRRFRDDHLRHVDDLNKLIRDRGGKVIEKEGVGSMLLASLVGMAMQLDVTAVVVALMTNEHLTNNSYEAALEFDWDDDVLAVLERNTSDERHHLEWLMNRENELTEEAEQPGASV